MRNFLAGGREKDFPPTNMPAVGAASLPRSQKRSFLWLINFNPVRCIGCPRILARLWVLARDPDGRKFECVDNPKNTSISVSFLSDAKQLKALLPECFELGGEPVVSVYANYMKEIEWLAGRGYNILGVSFPAVFKGARDHVRGPFLSVLWENLCDPIITGREELGFSKIYCEMARAAYYEQ